MLSLRDEYIHIMAPKNILAILQQPWATKNQSITSATTNTNDLVEPDLAYTQTGENTAGTNAFADINFGAKTHRILDLGGGKFDVNIHYMKQRKVELLVWDPFNRSREHNSEIQTALSEIAALQKKLANDLPYFKDKQSQSHQRLYTHQMRLFSINKSFLRKWEDEFLEKHRHEDPNLQTEYDKRFALMVI